MPHVINLSQFQKRPKPAFCYLCGVTLNNGTILNDDHCPPKGMFALVDRVNYPIKLRVHATCNHSWHAEDETMAFFYNILHGNVKALTSTSQRKLSFLDIENDQGTYLGITNFPIQPLVHRVVRCMHALLYNRYLPIQTEHHIHLPIPEVDFSNGNKPIMHKALTYAFADKLCIAQKTRTYDSVVAYNQQFRYVCTWSKLNNGLPICIFALDIYRLSRLAVIIKDFPNAVIGSYRVPETPIGATKCSDLSVDNTDEEILYPILES